jgi:glycerate 2-kinase
MRLRLPASPVRPLLRKLIAAGLRAADPSDAIRRIVSRNGDRLSIGGRLYDLTRYDRVLTVGAGKASARMAQALERILGKRLEGGLVVVKTGHTVPTRRVRVVEAGHPIPDRAGLLAAEQIRALLAPLTSRDLVIVLLSGGASSLLPAPVSPLSLPDKQRTTRLLLNSGVTIQRQSSLCCCPTSSATIWPPSRPARPRRIPPRIARLSPRCDDPASGAESLIRCARIS